MNSKKFSSALFYRLMTQLVPGEMIVRKDGQEDFLAVGEGLVEITGHSVNIPKIFFRGSGYRPRFIGPFACATVRKTPPSQALTDPPSEDQACLGLRRFTLGCIMRLSLPKKTHPYGHGSAEPIAGMI